MCFVHPKSFDSVKQIVNIVNVGNPDCWMVDIGVCTAGIWIGLMLNDINAFSNIVWIEFLVGDILFFGTHFLAGRLQDADDSNRRLFCTSNAVEGIEDWSVVYYVWRVRLLLLTTCYSISFQCMMICGAAVDCTGMSAGAMIAICFVGP